MNASIQKIAAAVAFKQATKITAQAIVKANFAIVQGYVSLLSTTIPVFSKTGKIIGKTIYKIHNRRSK